MVGRKALFAAVVAAVAGLGFANAVSAQSLAHIGHVGESFNGTPDNAGLLVTAQLEAEVAEQHAGLAMNSDELASVKLHIGHVMHALDPESIESGPGKGYGVIAAANGAARHIKMAGEADDATSSAETHTVHVHAAAANVASWAEVALEMCNEVQATDDLAKAKELAAEIHQATQAMLDGVDANGDGKVSWQEGEGGLAQASTHLGLIN